MNMILEHYFVKIAVGVVALCALFSFGYFAFLANAQVDYVAPTIASVSASGTLLTVTTSEPVYAPAGAGQHDFAVFNCVGDYLGNAQVSGLATSGFGNTDASFTVQFSEGVCDGDVLLYLGSSIRDNAGNVMPLHGNLTTGNVISGGTIQPPEEPSDGDYKTLLTPPQFLDTGDTAAPTISSVVKDGKKLTVTMSEPVFAHGPVSFSLGEHLACINAWIEVAKVDISRTVATASDTFTITFTEEPYALYLLYLYSSNTTKPIMDQNGNTLGQYGNSYAYGQYRNMVLDTSGPTVSCPPGSVPQEPIDYYQPPVESPIDDTDQINSDDPPNTPPQEPVDNTQPPVDNTLLRGNTVSFSPTLSVNGTTATFQFSYSCSGTSCEGHDAHYSFIDSTTACDTFAYPFNSLDYELITVGTNTKQGNASVAGHGGEYLCVVVTDNYVHQDVYHKYLIPSSVPSN